ncbi:HAD family hydrolase [Vogesella indigofera]|uniref:HAD family hydrolase n=1 Tax=Vogesella indigofera TaxID=45465 RepID=UPI003F439420
MPYDAILLDMDGLMIDTEQLCAQAWRDAASELGTRIGEDTLHQLVGLSHQHCLRYLQQHPELSAHMPALALLNRQYYHQQLQHGDIPLKPGITALLDWLQQQAIPCAVGTATEGPLAQLKLQRSQLAPYFQHVVSASDVANSKPAPDIYLAAAARLQVEPARCIVLEDSVHGASAALAANMRVIIVPDIVQPPASMAKQALAVCKDLFAARALLQQLLDA